MMSPNKEAPQNDSEYNTRQRLESCSHGIQQLEALRLKHKLLMEQIRRDYPSMNSLIKSLSGDEVSDPIAQNSPSSTCSLTPSHLSDDSGYAPNNSGTSTGLSEHPMDYNTFRKLSLEEHPTHKNVRPNSTHIVEATLKNLTSQQLPSTSDYPWIQLRESRNSSTWSRLHKRRNPLNSNQIRPKSCYGSASQQEAESTRPKSMILSDSKRACKLLDSNIFSQITPPLLQRKFATQPSTQKLEDPPQIRVKQMPKRETPILRPKILSSRSVKLQKAELRTLLPTSSNNSPKITPKQQQPTAKSWQQSFNSRYAPPKQDSTVQCSKDVPRFSINTKVPSPAQSRVANAVKSLNNTMTPQKSENYDKYKKNVASVSPVQKPSPNPYSNISNGSTTFPAARKHQQMPLIGLATISKKPQNMVTPQPQTFTSSCSISLGVPFKKPTDQTFIRMRRQQNEWNISEKL